MSTKICPIDSVEMIYQFSSRILSKYDVAFFQCPACRLLQTEDPYWLNEAYVQAYNDTDTGLASRNVLNRLRLEPVLNLLYKCQGSFLDIGGGYGLFARLMRDIGINFFTTDRYCESIFARQFAPSNDFTATALFSFEVFEHLPDPVTFLKENFSKYACKTIFFTTETYTSEIPDIEWPYYGFSHGQHITFYHPDSLRCLAASLGCTYTHLFSDIHLISERPLSLLEKGILTNRALILPYALLTRALRWNKSFTQSDSIQTQI
ncbi:MAG: class I SAM-dependent methyltransferase [bacterium]